MILTSLVHLFFAAPTFAASVSTLAPAPPVADWSFVERTLQRGRFSAPFIHHLKSTYETRDFLRTVELNVLLFLRERDDHGVQVSESAGDNVDKFIKEHGKTFAEVEKAYGVNPKVIASLLWLESRFGQNRGRYHVPSIYLHLLQAPRPEVVRHLRQTAPTFRAKVTKKHLAEVKARTRKKSDWALEELRALEQLFLKDRKSLRHLRGSFAGAFGIPQFIPSSYLRWSRAAKPGVMADLDRPDDAIWSVGHYLHVSGWRRKNKKSFELALMKYNNSRDYARAILKLAGI